MKKWHEKLSFWKSISDFVLYLVVLGMITDWIGDAFMPIAKFILGFGLIINFIFIIKNLVRRK